jgi:hypothetical protein
MPQKRTFTDLAHLSSEDYAIEANRRFAKQWREKNPDKQKTSEKKSRRKEVTQRSHMKRRYGLSWNRYQEMLEEQQGRCKICRDIMKRPAIDHCHKTGKVRGLLCDGCNFAIGLLKDDPEIVDRAAAYLRDIDVGGETEDLGDLPARRREPQDKEPGRSTVIA